jgi:hypothetical protein
VFEAAPLTVPLPTGSALTTAKTELLKVGSQWSLVAQFDGQIASSFQNLLRSGVGCD